MVGTQSRFSSQCLDSCDVKLLKRIYTQELWLCRVKFDDQFIKPVMLSFFIYCMSFLLLFSADDPHLQALSKQALVLSFEDLISSRVFSYAFLYKYIL